MPPVDVATNDTLKFLEGRLKLPGLRLLEVGCGDGDLAYALTQKKAQVQAIDISEESVAAAQKRGVDAKHADILQYQDAPFDVVLFSRCLHHVHPLESAVQCAIALLKPNGLLVLEDFAVEDADENTLSWLHHINLVLIAAGACNEKLRHQSVSASVEAWQHHHCVKHEVARSDSMLLAIRARFAKVEIETCPYLYRYVADNLHEDANGNLLAERVLEWERQLIKSAAIKPLGLRVVASQPARREA